MDLNDVALPADPAALPNVSPTGDLVPTSGRPSLDGWLLRALTTEPGALGHRPQFGAGPQRYVGQATPGAVAALQATAGRVVRRDRRVARAQVSASSPTPGRIDLEVRVTDTRQSDGSVVVRF